MKKHITTNFLFSLCLFALGLSPQRMNAQTTLALGDIAFTGYNCTTSPDEFSFVILKSTGITSGTQIKFTDIAWFSGACGTNGWATNLNSLTSGSLSDCSTGTETEITWTSASSLSFGTQVKIAGTTASSGTVTSGTGLAFPTTGDQVYAFQGTRTGTHTMLTALHANKYTGTPATSDASGWDNINSGNFASCNDNWGNKPTCLTTGTNCVWMLDGSSAEVDNGVYNCTGSNSNTSGAAITATRTAINTASNWTTQNTTGLTLPSAGCSPLPVTWMHFDASATDYGARLEWSTSSERNCSHFDVERSVNAIEWKKVGEVAGGGTKNAISTYSYDDVFNTEGMKYVYYRIRQVDFDYKFEYTPVRAAGKDENEGKYSAFTFNGNPISEATSLKTFLPSAAEAHIEIRDTRGTILFSKTFQYYGGYNRFMFNEQVPEIMNKSGVYFVKASIEGEEKIFKLVVQ